VLIDGSRHAICVRPYPPSAGAKVVTVEGLSLEDRTRCRRHGSRLDVPQCGFCQSGMIMAAAALLARSPRRPTREIERAMTTSAVAARTTAFARAIKPRRRAATRSAPGCRSFTDGSTT
jgi:aerobic-type carbon monoxide dehydrogenase small subunit (CoxS/CutS family)